MSESKRSERAQTMQEIIDDLLVNDTHPANPNVERRRREAIGRLLAWDVPWGAHVIIPMLLWCPSCGARHIDVGEFAKRPHHTHACQNCGMVWRPAILSTCGVNFLPGFKNEPEAGT